MTRRRADLWEGWRRSSAGTEKSGGTDFSRIIVWSGGCCGCCEVPDSPPTSISYRRCGSEGATCLQTHDTQAAETSSRSPVICTRLGLLAEDLLAIRFTEGMPVRAK